MVTELEYFKGILTIEQVENPHDMFISSFEESLFYRVPKCILSFIDGCPSKVTNVEIQYINDTGRIVLCVTEREEDKPIFTINVNIDKILKLTELEGIKKTEELRHEDFLFAIRSRQKILIRAISIYLKRNV